MIEDREQSFAAFVIETLARRDTELARTWAEGAELAAPGGGESSDDGARSACSAEGVVRALVVAAHDGGRSSDVAARAGRALGVEAYRRCVPLRQMLEELDALQEILLRAAERAAAAVDGDGAGRSDALVAARCICSAVSLLRIEATGAYADAAEDDLRGRYRAIRHDLRNALGTIKSAVALLTDESVPPQLRQASRVRALLARNASSLGRMIADALGDEAARLPPFRLGSGVSVRKQRDDLAGARQRPDLESGAL